MDEEPTGHWSSIRAVRHRAGGRRSYYAISHDGSVICLVFSSRADDGNKTKGCSRRTSVHDELMET